MCREPGWSCRLGGTWRLNPWGLGRKNYSRGPLGLRKFSIPWDQRRQKPVVTVKVLSCSFCFTELVCLQTVPSRSQSSDPLASTPLDRRTHWTLGRAHRSRLSGRGPRLWDPSPSSSRTTFDSVQEWTLRHRGWTLS